MKTYGAIDAAGLAARIVVLVADLAVEDAGAEGAEEAWWRGDQQEFRGLLAWPVGGERRGVKTYRWGKG